jgi:hypothetical protein
MKETLAILFNCGRRLSSGFFLRCRSFVLPLKKTRSELWAEWIGAAFGMLPLLLAPGAAPAAPCEVKNTAPPFIRHDLTVIYCKLCSNGYITIIISNPYAHAVTTDSTVVENLGSSVLTLDPTAPTPIPYSVNDGDLMLGSAPLVRGTNDSILTWNSSRVPTCAILKYRPANNQSNTSTALAANNVVFPSGSPCLVASNNIVDFIVTGKFAAFTSSGPWGDAYER